MPTTYTLTVWTVKPGEDDEFVRRWTEWVRWSHRRGLVSDARLLRDHEHPGTFVSFGPWANLEAVRQWRSDPEYHERVASLNEVVERFEPRTLELAAKG